MPEIIADSHHKQPPRAEMERGAQRFQLAQRAVGAAVPAEADRGAEVAVPGQAQLAVTAGNRRVDRHPLAVPRAADDHPGRLVTDYQRSGQPGVADTALGVPVQIRSADPGGAHPHQLLPGGGLGAGEAKVEGEGPPREDGVGGLRQDAPAVVGVGTLEGPTTVGVQAARTRTNAGARRIPSR